MSWTPKFVLAANFYGTYLNSDYFDDVVIVPDGDIDQVTQAVEPKIANINMLTNNEADIYVFCVVGVADLLQKINVDGRYILKHIPQAIQISEMKMNAAVQRMRQYNTRILWSTTYPISLPLFHKRQGWLLDDMPKSYGMSKGLKAEQKQLYLQCERFMDLCSVFNAQIGLPDFFLISKVYSSRDGIRDFQVKYLQGDGINPSAPVTMQWNVELPEYFDAIRRRSSERTVHPVPSIPSGSTLFNFGTPHHMAGAARMSYGASPHMAGPSGTLPYGAGSTGASNYPEQTFGKKGKRARRRPLPTVPLASEPSSKKAKIEDLLLNKLGSQSEDQQKKLALGMLKFISENIGEDVEMELNDNGVSTSATPPVGEQPRGDYRPGGDDIIKPKSVMERISSAPRMQPPLDSSPADKRPARQRLHYADGYQNQFSGNPLPNHLLPPGPHQYDVNTHRGGLLPTPHTPRWPAGEPLEYHAICNMPKGFPNMIKSVITGNEPVVRVDQHGVRSDYVLMMFKCSNRTERFNRVIADGTFQLNDKLGQVKVGSQRFPCFDDKVVLTGEESQLPSVRFLRTNQWLPGYDNTTAPMTALQKQVASFNVALYQLMEQRKQLVRKLRVSKDPSITLACQSPKVKNTESSLSKANIKIKPTVVKDEERTSEDTSVEEKASAIPTVGTSKALPAEEKNNAIITKETAIPEIDLTGSAENDWIELEDIGEESAINFVPGDEKINDDEIMEVKRDDIDPKACISGDQSLSVGTATQDAGEEMLADERMPSSSAEVISQSTALQPDPEADKLQSTELTVLDEEADVDPTLSQSRGLETTGADQPNSLPSEEITVEGTRENIDSQSVESVTTATHSIEYESAETTETTVNQSTESETIIAEATKTAVSQSTDSESVTAETTVETAETTANQSKESYSGTAEQTEADSQILTSQSMTEAMEEEPLTVDSNEQDGSVPE